MNTAYLNVDPETSTEVEETINHHVSTLDISPETHDAKLTFIYCQAW